MTVVVEFCDGDGRVVATVTVRERTMFWSDGRFAPAEAFAPHAGFFRRLEQSSRHFESVTGDAEATALSELAELWTDLNRRFQVRERGSSVWLVDVGLLLEGDRARVRYWAPESPPDTVSDTQLDELERLLASSPPEEVAAAARTYLPRLIAEVRRTRAT